MLTLRRIDQRLLRRLDLRHLLAPAFDPIRRRHSKNSFSTS